MKGMEGRASQLQFDVGYDIDGALKLNDLMESIEKFLNAHGIAVMGKDRYSMDHAYTTEEVEEALSYLEVNK